MTRLRVLLLSISVVVALAVAGCRGASPPPPATPVVTAIPASTGPRFEGSGVIASGDIVPRQVADLSFPLSGRVATVLVATGDLVEPHQPLVTLESDLLEAYVRQAEAALVVAQARLALRRVGPQPEEVAIARAQLAAAEGALALAQAERDRPEVGATRAEVAAAQGQVDGAIADHFLAEQMHEQTMKCVNVPMSGGEKREFCPMLGPTEEIARYSWWAADKQLDATRAELAGLLATGDAELRAAQAGVRTAAANRDVVDAELGTLLAGSTPEEIAAAEAAVKQAEAQLRAVHAALDPATLRAPFAGSVTAVDVSPGEAVTPGQIVITIADLAQLRARTTDLSEKDVTRVAVRQTATIYVEALDTEIAGSVVEVASQADTMGGDVVFGVDVALNDTPAALHWGMTAEVHIDAE